MTNLNYNKREKNHSEKLSDYWPLFSLIIVTVLAGYAVTFSIAGTLLHWMHYFMGFFLCCFSMLKIFNLSSFADGFQMYDILAKRSRLYAYIYPFIELVLGLGFLSFIAPIVIYSFTIIIMTIGIIGVFIALKKGLDINCPCMGSVLNVPLSSVTLTEDISMIIMSITMLVYHANIGSATKTGPDLPFLSL